MTNRVEKIIKKSIPIMVKDNDSSDMRKNFIEMGRSEVFCCLSSFGSAGVSTF